MRMLAYLQYKLQRYRHTMGDNDGYCTVLRQCIARSLIHVRESLINMFEITIIIYVNIMPR